MTTSTAATQTAGRGVLLRAHWRFLLRALMLAGFLFLLWMGSAAQAADEPEQALHRVSSPLASTAHAPASHLAEVGSGASRGLDAVHPTLRTAAPASTHHAAAQPDNQPVAQPVAQPVTESVDHVVRRASTSAAQVDTARRAVRPVLQTVTHTAVHAVSRSVERAQAAVTRATSIPPVVDVDTVTSLVSTSTSTLTDAAWEIGVPARTEPATAAVRAGTSPAAATVSGQSQSLSRDQRVAALSLATASATVPHLVSQPATQAPTPGAPALPEQPSTPAPTAHGSTGDHALVPSPLASRTGSALTSPAVGRDSVPDGPAFSPGSRPD